MIGDDYMIVPRYDHFDVLIDGEFYCSADTMQEAMEDVDQYYKDHPISNE